MSSSCSSSSSFWALQRTSRNHQVPRGLVGNSTISDERLAVRISVTPILYFNFGFFFCCSKWRLRKISKSHRQKRASPDMRERTLMTF